MLRVVDVVDEVDETSLSEQSVLREEVGDLEWSETSKTRKHILKEVGGPRFERAVGR